MRDKGREAGFSNSKRTPAKGSAATNSARRNRRARCLTSIQVILPFLSQVIEIVSLIVCVGIPSVYFLNVKFPVAVAPLLEQLEDVHLQDES